MFGLHRNIPKAVTKFSSSYTFAMFLFTRIGEDAFYGCTGLTSIEIGNSVTSIGSYAFSGCTGLKTVINFSKLTFAKYSSENGYIAYYADKVINAPNGFIYDDFVFASADDVSILFGYAGEDVDWVLPADCKGEYYEIGERAFSGCTSLKSIEIPCSVTSIGEAAFSSCTGLTSVVIPNNVISIGEAAFSGCTGLTSVVIPNNVTSIGEAAFSGCTNLSSIEVPAGVTRVGNEAFYGTAWYDNQPDGVVYAGNVLYKYKGIMPVKTKIVIKDGTTVIGDYAFEKCTSLVGIEIPNSITNIGNYAFYNCSGIASVEIPNSVTNIGEYAFFGCSLTSVVIPASVTSIGTFAFGNNKDLAEVTSLIPAEDLFEIPDIISKTFLGIMNGIYKLYVPIGAKDTYASTSGWDQFSEIIEKELTAINNVKGEPTVDASQSGKVKAVYNLNGRVVENPTNGIYIIDGKKVLLK